MSAIQFCSLLAIFVIYEQNLDQDRNSDELDKICYLPFCTYIYQYSTVRHFCFVRLERHHSSFLGRLFLWHLAIYSAAKHCVQSYSFLVYFRLPHPCVHSPVPALCQLTVCLSALLPRLPPVPPRLLSSVTICCRLFPPHLLPSVPTDSRATWLHPVPGRWRHVLRTR